MTAKHVDEYRNYTQRNRVKAVRCLFRGKEEANKSHARQSDGYKEGLLTRLTFFQKV